VTPRDKLRASLRANSEHVRQWPDWLRAAISTAGVFAPIQKGNGNGNMITQSIPTKSGWYRARWPGHTRWSCVSVSMTDTEASVYDPGVSRWRPLSDVVEWGLNVDSLQNEVVSLRKFVSAQGDCDVASAKENANLRADLRVATVTIANLRAAVDTLTTILDKGAR